MNIEERSELLKRIKDPADLAKFERLHALLEKRLVKQAVIAAGPMANLDITMACWKRVFGVDYPKTKPEAPRV